MRAYREKLIFALAVALLACAVLWMLNVGEEPQPAPREKDLHVTVPLPEALGNMALFVTPDPAAYYPGARPEAETIFGRTKKPPPSPSGFSRSW